MIFSHDWLLRVILDGNPIDEAGLRYLCLALLRSKTVQSVSLNRCGLGERAGSLLLRMLGEKPGLEVDASEGNVFGEEVLKKASYAHSSPPLSPFCYYSSTVLHCCVRNVYLTLIPSSLSPRQACSSKRVIN